MRNFKELKIWQQGMDIAIKTYQLTATFPIEDKYSLARQMNRAGISVPSNIAEGSSRKSEKDYARFIEVSLGSLFELETQLLIAQQLSKGKPELIEELKAAINEEQKMITGFQQCLNKN